MKLLDSPLRENALADTVFQPDNLVAEQSRTSGTQRLDAHTPDHRMVPCNAYGCFLQVSQSRLVQLVWTQGNRPIIQEG